MSRHGVPAMIAVRIGNDAFAADLAGFAAFLQRPAALATALGNELRNRLRSHFLAKDRNEPNKLNGDRTHFWRQVATSITPRAEVSDEGRSVSVSVTHEGFAQRLFGGTIRANKGLYLTIPVSSEAHGRTASTLEKDTSIKLVFVAKPYGGLLIEPPLAKGAPVKVHYILKPSVTQEADPTALPDEAVLTEQLRERAESVIKRAQESGQNFRQPTA
jgi:hypothetical protein